jgi:hypothetical protein
VGAPRQRRLRPHLSSLRSTHPFYPSHVTLIDLPEGRGITEVQPFATPSIARASLASRSVSPPASCEDRLISTLL